MSSQDAHKDAESSATPSLPERIAGRYLVIRLLGRGGFGAVYEAHDELEDRAVALKLIRRDGAANENAQVAASLDSSKSDSRSSLRRRGMVTRSFGTPGSAGGNVAQAFRDEFRLLTQLHHPNLAGVYDFGRCAEHDSLYFTQELVRGEDLTSFVASAPREVIVDLFVQLARALDYIHALGLVHGDIKPSNVMVCKPEGDVGMPQAKLIDFGLARMLRGREDEAQTEEEQEDDASGIMVIGTPGFTAPEKIRGLVADSRSDIYSLAATFYAAIRGQRAFSGKTFRETLRAQKDWRPELAGALLQSAGPVVAELVGRMLEPDPEHRPQSARSIVLELLRRETSHLRDRKQTERDRKEFAKVLVEHLPFVDRAHYLEVLLDRAASVMRMAEVEPSASARLRVGRVIRTVVVKAPEGMGKQRLMAELRREVQLGDGLFVEGSCWSNDHSALGPFAAVVKQLATALGRDSQTIRTFAPLIDLARARTGNDAVAGQLTEFLVSAASERPFVLHLSNLSRAREWIRNTFEQLCRAIDHSGAPLLLCATTEPHARIGAVLQTLGREQVAELWSLRPFSPKEMREVLGGVLGETAVLDDLTVMLDKLTGGHPLSFRETLRVLIEESILVRDSGSWTLRGASAAAEELHKTLAQRSESRLDSLGVSGWEIACTLYLLEAPIEEGQLAALSDLRPERFARTMDRLEGEGLINRNPASGASIVQLAHESVREAVRGRYEDSLDETRLDLASRIEELDADDPTFIFLRARLLDDASEGLEATDELEDAADRLLEGARPQLAAQVLERLIGRLRRYGGTTSLDQLLGAQLQLLTECPGAIEDPAREAAHYQAGILVAELLGNWRAQSLFWLGLADRTQSYDMEVILERLDQAAEAAKHAHDRVLELRIANRRAEVLLGAGEIEKASAWSREAMEIVELQQASPTDKCHIIGVRLRCLSLSGQIGEARRLHELGMEIAPEVPVVQRQSYLSGIAYLAVLGGDPGRAIPETEAAIGELQAGNLPRLLMTPLHNLGDLRLRNENLEQAEQAFREAIRLSAVYGFDYHLHLNRGFLGYVLARRGDAEEGAEMLSEAIDGMGGVSGEQVAMQQLRLLDAEVAHMRGESARARRELEEMLADFHAANELALAHWAQEALARIERDLGTNFIETPDSAQDTDPEQDTVRTKPVR